MEVWRNAEDIDFYLWEAFQIDFEGWTKGTFAIASDTVVRELRKFLLTHGVYVVQDRKRIIENVANVLLQEEYHEWTEEEVRHQLNRTNDLQSRWNPNSPHSSIKAAFPEVTSSSITYNNAPNIHTLDIKPDINAIRIPKNPVSTPDANIANRDSFQNPTILVIQSRQLTDLMKIYNDKKKFGGDMYDILNTKLKVFYDCCNKVGLNSDQYHNAFSIMLKGRAATFYYDKLAGRDYDFNTMIAQTKVHFETEENRQHYLYEWREATLSRICVENPTKNKLECLQLLDKLQKLQRGLTEDYQTDYSLRDQVLNACRGVQECSMALHKPAPTYEGVCHDLRSAIGAALRVSEIQQYHQLDNHEPDDHQQNWTDRIYGGRGISRGSSHSKVQDRGISRGSFRKGYSPSFQKGSTSRQKKCYCCGNINCWSSKHPIAERREAFEKFKQGHYVGDTLITPAYFQNFLTKYEGVEGLKMMIRKKYNNF